MNKFLVGLTVLAVSHVSFAAEVKEETVGNWLLETTINDETKKIERYAEIESLEDVEAAFSMRCEDDEFDFYFNIGDFFTKQDEQSLVIARDGEKAEIVKWQAAESWDAAFADKPHEFVKSILATKTLSVGYTTSENQNVTVKFDLNGIDDVYKNVAEVCPN